MTIDGSSADDGTTPVDTTGSPGGTIARPALEWEQVVVDALEPATLAHWWADALGWVVVSPSGDDEPEIRSSPDSLPGLLFVRVPEGKTLKNRLHLDFRPDDQDAEVARLLELGATRSDVGQTSDVSWVVLADPEGNEFCVLGERRAS
ncbi:VOC family protein [Frigoribacterium sp. CFBP 13712]|uniref:VOC family protein n=1 Tax=Frigoribacterium sp. CFBP 13712 TaxID=2775309 RepID=UPI0017849125|nr:VOC family protein [Frigoribacterium sp. CFBP 13712]MBD8703992.1 VOC family protein [Frigoribacterium sp. CFBP 13712]